MTTTCLVQDMLLVQRLTPGRRQTALVRMADVARETPVAALLLPPLERAVRAQDDTLVLLRQWQAEEGNRAIHGDGAQAVDVELDHALAGFHATLAGMARSFRAPKAAMAHEILDTMFPKGLGALTNQPYVDQHAATSSVLAGMKVAPFDDKVATLQLGDWLERIEELVVRYGQVVTRPRRLTFDEVRASDTAGFVALVEVVARVLGLFPTNDEQDAAHRTRLLQPLLDQQAEISALRARRKAAGQPLGSVEEELGVDPWSTEPADEPEATTPPPAGEPNPPPAQPPPPGTEPLG